MKKQQAFRVPEHGILSRPTSVVNSLPVEYRWEYTRRHPYYLLFWEAAHKHCQNLASDEPSKRLGEAATLMVRLIGVASDPPPPGTKFQDLDSGPLSAVWRDGAISVPTFRGLANAMLCELPPESRAAIGNLLVKSTSGKDGDVQRTYEAMSDLAALKDLSLDNAPAAPIIGVNVHAALRTILKALERRVKEWKRQLGIAEHRRRDEKLPDYLKVWDLREGWTGDAYDRRKEKTFSEIARELKQSVHTVVNRYRAAFRYLTGHEYRPDLWAHLFGAFKTSKLISPEAPRRSLRRPWKSPKKREVPETTVARRRRADHGGSFLENLAIIRDMRESADLIMDVQALLERGYDSQRIAVELEIAEPHAKDMIEYLRLRHDEGV